MIFRVPSYYKDFKCIAGDCQHSCCIGWEVDIDEDTSSYYKSVEGAFGERLAKHMRSEEIDYFALEENGWCPFLNEQKLCDICIALGEEALSEVCTEYPRFTMEYENVREKVLSLSCEEVGRLVFSTDEKMTWEERELPGDIEGWKEDEEDEDEEDDEADETSGNTDETGEKSMVEAEVTAEELESVRTHAVEILQDRMKPVFERAAGYLRYCSAMQQKLFGGGECVAEVKLDREQRIAGRVSDETQRTSEGKNIAVDQNRWDNQNIFQDRGNAKEAYENFEKRLECFEELEVLDETWTQVKEELSETFTEENYLSAQQEFAATEDMREYEYEHLLVYFTFRYFMRAYYDDNILSKAQFAVLGVLMIRDMDVARYLANGKKFALSDRIDTARIYSREVEHSEENMEMLADDFNFEESFRVEKLVKQLLL